MNLKAYAAAYADCAGCGQRVPLRYWFMLLPEVHAEAGGDAALCVACAEARLGRELDYADFSTLPPDRRGGPW